MVEARRPTRWPGVLLALLLGTLIYLALPRPPKGIPAALDEVKAVVYKHQHAHGRLPADFGQLEASLRKQFGDSFRRLVCHGSERYTLVIDRRGTTMISIAYRVDEDGHLQQLDVAIAPDDSVLDE